MEQLVYSLTGRVRAPVRDRTGLVGTFDYDVIFALNDLQTDANSPPMVTTAIQEELGLKLEKSKIPVKALAVDHADETDCELDWISLYSNSSGVGTRHAPLYSGSAKLYSTPPAEIATNCLPSTA